MSARERSEEKAVRILWPSESLLKTIEKEIVSSPVITPQSLAIKYGIRVSTAKKLLRDYHKKGLVVYVNGNSKLRIYRGVKAK
jgi:small subunit ribosomal protein S25e